MVEFAPGMPVVVTPGFAVVVDGGSVVMLGMMVVVLAVLKPVRLLKEMELKMVNGQKLGSRMGLDCGPQNSVPVTTPLYDMEWKSVSNDVYDRDGTHLSKSM